MKALLLISGPIAVGKSSLAKLLKETHQFHSISSSSHLKAIAQSRQLSATREQLSEIGDSLDNETDFGWVVFDVAIPMLQKNPNIEFWLFDAVRKQRQVEHFRNHFGADVLHVHLLAKEEILQQRYNKRLSGGEEYLGHKSYAEMVGYSNEIAARSLKSNADMLLDAGELSFEVMANLITKRVGKQLCRK